MLASSVHSTSKTNRTYALFMTSRTGSSSPRPNDIDGLSLQYYWHHWPHYRSPAEFRNVCNCTPILWCCSIKHGGTSYWTFAQQRCRQSLTILDFSFLRQGEPRIMPHHSQNGCLSTRNGAICILNISPDIIVPSISSSKRSISKRFSYRWYLSITCFSANRRWPDHSFHYVDIIKRSVWIYSCFKFLLVRIPSSSLCYQIFALFFLCCTH